MFSSCSLLLACKINEVTLNIGPTLGDAMSYGQEVMAVAEGDTDTAYFYAVCDVANNADEYDLEWEYVLDGGDQLIMAGTDGTTQATGGIVIRTLNVQLHDTEEHFVLRIGW